MPLSFLHPWFWFGVLAIGAPLWLHLRRRKQTNLHRFSTVRFLEDQPVPRRRPMHLRDLLLFALRAAALLLLLAAFAWPYVKTRNTVPIEESRVYVLDNTLSHQAAGGFFRDRDRVAEELSRTTHDIQAAVIELTSVPRVIAGFADQPQVAAQRVRDLQPSFQRGSYLAAFRQANALLENSLGGRKRIIFAGDNQQNQWKENVSTPPFLRDIQVDLPGTSVPVLPNLSVSDPRVQRIFLGDKSLVNFTARLTHSGSAQSATLAVSANGQQVLSRTLDLSKQPETMLIQAQWEADPKEWVRGQIALEGKPDSLAADDHAYFSLPPVAEGKLALLAQSPYLRLALSPEIMRGEWAARILDPARLSVENAADPNADVLCLESGYLQSAEARKLLTGYLSAGRGVLLLVNRTTPAVDGCLRELGFESEGMVQTPAEQAEKFQFVMSNHPIFHPFLSADYGNLMEIKVTQYARLRSRQSMPLVFGQKGEGLFFSGTKSKGKLLVCAFGLDRDQTSWPIHQSFIPFLDLALQAARADDPVPLAYEPGQTATLPLPKAAQGDVVLRSGERELARFASEQGKVQVRMPNQPGIYSITFADSPQVQKVFTVNPSPKESDLTYQDNPEVLKTWNVPTTAARKQPAEAQPGHGLRLAGVLQQQFWWWMVLGGLAALLIETAWVGSRKEAG